MSQLPEVRETDASPEIAAIYADIKESAALPQVNLIFRHFATKPGVLAWIWQTLRPLYRSNELSAAADDLTRSIARPGLSPLMAALSGDDLADCKYVIDAYNSGNPQNLIALTALVRVLEKLPRPDEAEPMALTPRQSFLSTADAAAFPALPRRDELETDMLARVERMAARHPGAPGVVPSMYLHLALWPSALEVADIYLQPMIESPGWAPLVASVVEQAGGIAQELAPGIELAPAPPDAATLEVVAGTIKAFIRQTIPELITVGRLLAVE
ncbi:MAG: hypothetical protein ACR2PI_06120 [Hyphomicrobiaceae bacterium]